MKKLILFLLFVPFFSFSQSSMNMNLLGSLNYSNTNCSDIWGWEDGLGNEYALVGLTNGFSCVNVTNPISPIEEFFISDLNSTWRDIKTWGNYAYVTTEANAGLLIVDLTDMTGNTYSHVTQFTNNSGGSTSFTSSHNIYIDENGIAYIFGAAGSGNTSDGAIFLDVASNPNNPVYLGEWDDYYIHDGMARGDTMYAGCIYEGKMFIVDVSNKSNPQTLGSATTPNSFTHNAWVSDDGDYVFTTDETSDAYLTAYDISNITNIQEVDRIQSNPGSNSIPHNAHVDGNFLITSYYRDGTTVHDITYPNYMIQVAYYDSYAGSGNGFNGCWGTYPFLSSGNIISSDRDSYNGKGVLNIYGRDFQQACYLMGNVTDGITSNAISNASIEIISTSITANTNLLGSYQTASVSSGTFQVLFSASGYIPITLNVTLSSGNMIILDAALFPGSGLPGCTDPTAVNYDPAATIDDGSCTYAGVVGCMNSNASNYDPLATSSIAYGGILDTNVGSGSYFIGNQHLIFDAYVESKIVSADVYAQSSNTITFELRDNSGSVLDDTTITVSGGQERLYFDFDVPVGANYQLGIAGSNSGLYRNNDQANVNYPYNIDGLIEITESSASVSDQYYYFYYDIEVESVCTGITSTVYGCTDPLACNYDSSAIVDDGSCFYQSNPVTDMSLYTWKFNSQWGCSSTIYSSQIEFDSLGSGVVNPGTFGSTNVNWSLCDSVLSIIYSGGTLFTSTDYNNGTFTGTMVSGSGSSTGCFTLTPIIPGCLDSTSNLYNPLANYDDGSCCDNYMRLNMYSSWSGGGWNSGTWWTILDLSGNVVYTTQYVYNSGTDTYNSPQYFCLPIGCYTITCNGTNGGLGSVSWSLYHTNTSTTAANGGAPYINQISIGGVICPIFGCTDSSANNYDPTATLDNGSCIYLGCTDPLALNYNSNATLDDGSCLYCSCGGITGINVSNIIHDRAIFNWDNMNSSCCPVDQIRIRYREVGTNAYSTKTMGTPVGSGCNTTNTSKLVLNLTPSTQYEYEFKIWYCNAGTVNWHAGGTFTTAPQCDNVINVIPTPITTTKTTFCWDTVSTYSFVRLKYREDVPGSSFSNIGGMGVHSPTLCKDKNGLTPGLTYRVMWRAWCNPNGGPYRSPVWDGPVIWTQPTSIRLEGGDTIANLVIYPNPSRDIFNINFTSEDVQDLRVKVLNVVGEILINEELQQFIGEYTKQIDLTNNAKGIYFLEIETDDGVINKKLIFY